MQREIKQRNVFTVYALMILTFGIYGLVWTVKSKRDMNALGSDIPTSWLLIVPLVNFYWMYKYCEGFSCHIKKDDNTMLWFMVQIFAGFVMPAIVQSSLNDFTAAKKRPKATGHIHKSAA